MLSTPLLLLLLFRLLCSFFLLVFFLLLLLLFGLLAYCLFQLRDKWLAGGSACAAVC